MVRELRLAIAARALAFLPPPVPRLAPPNRVTACNRRGRTSLEAETGLHVTGASKR